MNETIVCVVLQLKDIEKKLNDYRKHQGKNLLHRDYNSADGESHLPLLTSHPPYVVRTHTLSLFDLLDPPSFTVTSAFIVCHFPGVVIYLLPPTCTFLINDVKICIIIHMSLVLVSLVKCHFEYHYK